MTTLPATHESQVIVKKVYQAFFSPSKYEVKSSEQGVLENGNSYRVTFGGGELALTCWGNSSPSVLLMHGWGGSRAQMTGFVEPLLKAGYRVVAYDQPAHGDIPFKRAFDAHPAAPAQVALP